MVEQLETRRLMSATAIPSDIDAAGTTADIAYVMLDPDVPNMACSAVCFRRELGQGREKAYYPQEPHMPNEPQANHTAHTEPSPDADTWPTRDDVTFGPFYRNGRSADFGSKGLIDDIGGFGYMDQPGPGEHLLFTIPMTANQSGAARYSGKPADGSGHELLVFGDLDEDTIRYESIVPWNQVEFIDTTLVIDPSLDDVVTSGKSTTATSETIGAGEHVEDENGPTVRIRLQTCDLKGNPINRVRPGEDFLLQAFVEDLRTDAEGVFAAYLDVAYDENLVSVSGYGNNHASAENPDRDEAPKNTDVGVDIVDNAQSDHRGQIARHEHADTVPFSPKVGIRFQPTDLDGNPINQIAPGANFLLQVFVEDLRPDAEGVFATYVDVNYDENLVSVIGQDRDDITYDPLFPNGRSGDLAAFGLIDELGSFGGMSVLGPGEYLLATIEMHAEHSDEVVFTGDPADGIGNEVLVYGENTPVAWSDVEFTPATLVIASSPSGPAASEGSPRSSANQSVDYILGRSLVRDFAQNDPPAMAGLQPSVLPDLSPQEKADFGPATNILTAAFTPLGANTRDLRTSPLGRHLGGSSGSFLGLRESWEQTSALTPEIEEVISDIADHVSDVLGNATAEDWLFGQAP